MAEVNNNTITDGSESLHDWTISQLPADTAAEISKSLEVAKGLAVSSFEQGLVNPEVNANSEDRGRATTPTTTAIEQLKTTDDIEALARYILGLSLLIKKYRRETATTAGYETDDTYLRDLGLPEDEQLHSNKMMDQNDFALGA